MASKVSKLGPAQLKQALANLPGCHAKASLPHRRHGRRRHRQGDIKKILTLAISLVAIISVWIALSWHNDAGADQGFCFGTAVTLTVSGIQMQPDRNEGAPRSVRTWRYDVTREIASTTATRKHVEHPNEATLLLDADANTRQLVARYAN